jgi:hypothetical protein
MALSFSLCWVGIALIVLAAPERLRAVLPLEPSRLASRVMRLLGSLGVLLAVFALAPETGSALAVVGTLVSVMTVASLSALLVPLRPRLYAASVPVVALAAAVLLVLR